MKKIVLCFVLLIGIIPKVYAEDVNLAEKAKSAILIEPTTGEIIFEKNSHEKLHPASMTKMMSMLLVVEAIENKSLSWDEKIRVSENASSMGGSQILLETGEEMSVRDLFKGVAIASGNDAVVALAERVAGTKDAFVTMMNKRAKELNLKDTNFKNPHGLDDANHYSSAHDMAMIAKELTKHEIVFEYTSIYEDYLRKDTDREIWLVNTNKLVRFYEGADGMKTGYTKEAGYCLTATAKRNGMRMIAVVMGEEDSKIRNSEASAMLDYAFAQYQLDTILTKNTTIQKIKIDKAKQKQFTIIPKEDITFLYKKSEKKKKIDYTLELQKVKAPLKKGDKIGNIIIKENGKDIRKIDAIIKENVEKANIIELYLKHITDIFKGDISIRS